MAQINALNFLAQASLAADTIFENTDVRDLSGIVYDSNNDVYYVVSNDQTNPRFYTLEIDLTNNSIDAVTITDVTTLNDNSGNPLTDNTTDLEGIALTSSGTIFLASEGILDESGTTDNHINPFLREFNLTTGNQVDDVTIPDKFIPEGALSDDAMIVGGFGNPITPTIGVRDNFAFESLTLTEDEQFLFTAVEAPLAQDSSSDNIVAGGTLFNRIIQFEPSTDTYAATAEYLYIPEAFHNITDILALDRDTLIVVERNPLAAGGLSDSFDIQIYEADLSVATDISGTEGLNDNQGDIVEVSKNLLVDFDDLGIDGNFEGLSFGSDVNGNPSLIVVSDNNGTQESQFVAFEIELATPTTVDFAEATYTFAENDGIVELILNRSGDDLSTSSVVTVAVTNETTTGDADYTNIFPVDVTFNPDETTATVSLEILEDDVTDDGETINLVITSNEDIIGTQDTTVVTITDVPPVEPIAVDFDAANYTVTEDGGSVDLILNRSGGDLSTSSIVNVAITNETTTLDVDYTNIFPLEVTFNPNETTATVTVGILDDQDVEDTETIDFTLTSDENILGSQTTTVLSITDNDTDVVPLTVDFEAANYTVTEDGGSVDLILNRSGDDLSTSSVVTVAVTNETTTADVDYTNIFPVEVTFNPNETTATVTVGILDDQDIENTETIDFTLTAVGEVNIGTQATSTVSITDNDQNTQTEELELTANNSFFFNADVNTTGLEFNLISVSEDFTTGEVGIYFIENNQSITDILTTGQTIFSGLEQVSLDFFTTENFSFGNRIIQGLTSGEEIGFYLIPDSTSDDVLDGTTPESTVILGDVGVEISQQQEGSFTVSFNDGQDASFGDIEISMATTTESAPLGASSQGNTELFDVTAFSGQSVALTVTSVQEAALSNLGGLYQIVNDQGGVIDTATGAIVNPGDANYAEIAYANRVLEFSGNDQASVTLDGGFSYVPYVIADGNPDDFYSTFFSSDGFDHLLQLGDNQFGFEDLPNLGDADYNDFVFQINAELI